MTASTMWGRPRAARRARCSAASNPLLDDIGAVYLKDNDISPVNDEQLPVTADSVPSEVASHALDPRSAQRLWELGELMIRS